MDNFKRINIPAPCYQSWQQMEPNGQGRHCLHCCKTVVDFSKMTGDEVIGYLANQTNVCGRFGEHQLTTINRQLDDENLAGTNRWKKWLVAASILGTAILNRASAQTSPANPLATQQAPVSQASSFPLGKIVMIDSAKATKITGLVIGADDKLPIPGVSIGIKGTSFGTVSDNNGHFTLKGSGANQTLVIRYIGYATQEVSVQPATNQPVFVSLVLNPQIMGEVVIVQRPFYTRWYNRFIRRPVHKLFHPKKAALR
jgi:hypothetical protein